MEGGVEEDGFDTEDGNQEDGFHTERGGSEIGRFRQGRRWWRAWWRVVRFDKEGGSVFSDPSCVGGPGKRPHRKSLGTN